MVHFPSKTIENAVEALSGFPGIGKRSAVRMVMHLLKRPDAEIRNLSQVISELKTRLKQCRECCNISDSEICDLCSSVNRNSQIISGLEEIIDVMYIVNTLKNNVLYNVLGL